MDQANASDQDLSALSQSELEAHLDGLCRRYAATEYQLLCCIRECERRGGTLSHGMKSTAHWLNARFGIALGAAREKVRVATALESLPETSAALGAGSISYSKVRALSRIATPENERDLLRLASESTASDLERMTTEYRQLQHLDDPEWPMIQYRMRRLGWYWDEEGMLMVEGRLPPEEGALFIKLIESMRDHLYRQERSAAQAAETGAGVGLDAAASVACAEAAGRAPEQSKSVSQRSMDALLQLVETGSRSEPQALTGAERMQVVLHVAVDESTAQSQANADAASSYSEIETDVRQRPRLTPGTVVAAETARRLCCDAARVLMVENAEGDPLSVGRQSRAVPWHIRKALEQRDGGCTFPGCSERRYVDAHHIRHWVDGGETSLANCTLLCRHHHRLVHEAGYACERVDDRIVFRGPDGRELTVPQRAADSAVVPTIGWSDGFVPGDVSAETSVRDGDTSGLLWEACSCGRTEHGSRAAVSRGGGGHAPSLRSVGG